MIGASGSAGKTAAPESNVIRASATEEETASTPGSSHQPAPRRVSGIAPRLGRSWTSASCWAGPDRKGGLRGRSLGVCIFRVLFPKADGGRELRSAVLRIDNDFGS